MNRWSDAESSVGRRWIKTMSAQCAVRQVLSVRCPELTGPANELYRFLIFNHLTGCRSTALARRTREGATSSSPAPCYMSIASAISTEPPDASNGQPFALAAASS